jgi:fibronectin-binding autotransporter adhesin
MKNIISRAFSRIALIATLAASLLLASSDRGLAASASWIAAPSNGNWEPGTGNTNWSTGPGTFPGATAGISNTDVATFNVASTITTIIINNGPYPGSRLQIGGITFTGAASNYTIGIVGGQEIFTSSFGSTVQIDSALTATNRTETINAPFLLGGDLTFANNSANGSGAGAGTLIIAGGVNTIPGDLGGTVFLTGSNTNANTVSGTINDGSSGPVAVVKNGVGKWILSGSNTFTGTATINAGTLQANAAGALGGTTGITVNSGGTLLLSNSGTNNRINDSATMTLNANGSSTVAFNTGGLSEHGATNNTAGIGALTLQSSSIIDMGNTASIIAFANSAAQSAAWGTGRTISIYNWSGTPLTGGGIDELFFGNNALGLTATQLAEFQFYSGAGTGAFTPGAIILSTGEVVPLSAVPEPSTWVAALLTVAIIGYSGRRRFWATR